MYVTYNKKAIKVIKEIMKIQKQQLNHSRKSQLLSKFCHNKYLLSIRIY